MKIWIAVLVAMLIAGIFFPPMLVVFLLADIVFILYIVIRRLTMPKDELQKIREENAKKVAAAKEKQVQGKAEFEKLRAAERARKADDCRVVSAVLISTDNKKSAVGAAGRAAVGGALFGPVGAIAGAASGTSKAKNATFSVKYASGRTATETVPVESKRFNELSALLHQ